jgi:cellulose synthase/poly-beta-1,6-N-acetylglucosamine synthase-like glycosyltransferase
MTYAVLIFLFFAALLVWVSFGSVAGGIRFLRYFRRKLSEEPPPKLPFATVIVPCRGVDPGLQENLAALFAQDYPEFEVVFATEGPDDACVAMLERFVGERDARIVVAGSAEGESQKVRNLREAVSAVSPRSEVLVFMDSDARPPARWLVSLVSELGQEGIGAATGYRWFLPGRAAFASELRSAWNASVASRLGEDASKNFCWGGSTAVRRRVFDDLGMAQAWRGTLSDDYALMRALRQAGLGIAFAPGAMTANFEECSFREAVEFTTRQMKITRVYAPGLWASGFAGSFLFNLVAVWGVYLSVSESGSAAGWAASTALALVWGLGVGKAWVRLRAVETALPAHAARLRRQTLAQTALWVLTPALFLWNCVAALVSREVVWRGTRYRMVSPERTELK